MGLLELQPGPGPREGFAADSSGDGGLPGRKDDGAFGTGRMKDRWDLLPIGPVRQVVRVLTYGAAEYAPGNWMHVPDARDRYFAAAMRHLASWRDGELVDCESSLPHLAHACCCLLFLLWFEERQ